MLAFWGLANRLSLEEFLSALARHQADPQAGAYFPKPADILKHSRKGQQTRHSANEAWAMAVKAADEGDTVVW
jgi:hypothetical protein